MVNDILQKLSESPDKIVELLDDFGCAKFRINTRYISFARDDRPESGMSISILIHDNPACFVKDFAHNESNNIISFLCKEKGVKFIEVLNDIKRILNLSEDWRPPNRRSLFGGCYDGIIHREDYPLNIYEESMLDAYLKIPNKRFLNDRISLAVQVEFGIGYDIDSNRITIPIRDQHGSLIGVKGRKNYNSDNEDDPKYMYLIPAQMSKTLYGFSQNYAEMYGVDIMVFESEKSVLQCASYGLRNAVSLGSNSLSEYQAKLLLSLNPRGVIFMLDNDLPLENTKRNIEVLQSACTMRDLKISYFDWTNCLDLPSKASPSDDGKETLINILENYVVDAGVLFSHKTATKEDFEEEIDI